ncbi:MAG: hypothetical protein HY055_18085 [Magnetospirillum sp.]|nr:hypothetical protein [Magnetospirillum sp.]
MSLQRYSFGAGKVFATPTNGTNSTPIQLFDIQEASMAIKAKAGSGRGGTVAPVVLGRTEEDVTGKVKFLRNDPRIEAYLFYGVDITTGMVTLADGEAAVAADSVQVANHAGFMYDNGVLNATDGSSLTRITQGTPQAGQYSCDTSGTYVFSAADATAHLAVLISYSYTDNTQGFGYTVYNREQGLAPYFRLHLHKAYNSPSGLMTEDRIIYAAQATGITPGGKAGEANTIEIDWQAVPDALNRIQSRWVNGVKI